MLQVLNYTAFETNLGVFTDQHGADKVAVAVKGTFKIPESPTDTIELADEQLPNLYCDEYFDEPGESGIQYPVDMVMGKTTTDIGLVGHAHSQDGKSVTRLPVSLKVGEYQKKILVIGDRQWRKKQTSAGFLHLRPRTVFKNAVGLRTGFRRFRHFS